MKLIFLILCATASIAYGQLFDGRFTVPVDHFRPQDGRTVTFHYKTNIEFYDDDGPLFFYLNDAGSFTTEWIERGMVADLAMEFGGAMFTANFRFFRDNLPTPTASLTDLQHLTLDQALADVAVFIHTARQLSWCYLIDVIRKTT